MFHTCCSKLICMGCVVAQTMSNTDDELKATRCPFCREPAPDSSEESDSKLMERVEANDPAAMIQFGRQRYDAGDYGGALKYYTKAAELGDADGHYRLGEMYFKGVGVERDEKKSVYCSELAAIGGHTGARYTLAFMEWKDGRTERAVKHFIIAAKLGCEVSMKSLWR